MGRAYHLLLVRSIAFARKQSRTIIYQERGLQQGRAIVVDIGKTHAKVSLWTREGKCLSRLTRANVPQRGGPYPALGTAATADWLIESLKQFAGHPVEAIIPVAHGAAVAGVRRGALAFSIPDYEWELPAETLEAYRATRDSFALTGSPALPMGLNLGAQLHAMEAMGDLADVTLLPYAQYWAWLLSGVAASEVTSLGCHSDLWSPVAADYSPMARRRGWAEMFAPMARAGDALGPLLADLAALTGLPGAAQVHAGLHDSNAALLAARGFPEIADQEATVLSTGTWFVAMRSPKAPVDLAALPEARDCLVNIDVRGQPVPSARFMGGREIELLSGYIEGSGMEGLAPVLASRALILPSQVPLCGPFPASQPRWINRPDEAPGRRAAIALYAALMADTALGLIGAKGCLLVEGRFASSEMFVRTLATLRPDMTVYTAASEADVSFGSLRLIWPELAPSGGLARVQPLDHEITSYRAEWLDSIAHYSQTSPGE